MTTNFSFQITLLRTYFIIGILSLYRTRNTDNTYSQVNIYCQLVDARVNNNCVLTSAGKINNWSLIHCHMLCNFRNVKISGSAPDKSP